MKTRILTALLAIAMAGLSSPAAAQQQVLTALKTAAQNAPKDIAAQVAYGRALIEANQLDAAEAQMRRAVKLDPESVTTRFEAMRVKFAEGHYKRVRAACKELQKLDPKHVLTHVCSARALLVWRRASRAFEHVDRALAADPNNFEAVLAQADAKRLQGDFAGAISAYKQAVSIGGPFVGDAHLGLGKLYLVQRKQREALESLRKARAAAPDDPDVLFELGRVLVEARDAGEGAKLLRRALDGRPAWDEAKLQLAIAQLRSGQGDAAEAALAAFLKEHAKHPIATAQYGAALVATGKYAEAEQTLARALELIPNDFDTAFALAQLYEKTGRSEEAFTQYRAAADLKRESAVPLIEAGRLGLKQGRALLAGALLDKALEREPHNGEALGLYGDVLAARGDKKAARQYYQRALAGQGQFDRRRVQQRLQQLE